MEPFVKLVFVKHSILDTWQGSECNPCNCSENISSLEETSSRNFVHPLSRQLLVQSQQRKHQNNVWNLFKVNNKDTRRTSATSLWCLYCWLWIDFTHCSSVSIVDLEQVVAVRAVNRWPKLNKSNTFIWLPGNHMDKLRRFNVSF